MKRTNSEAKSGMKRINYAAKSRVSKNKFNRISMKSRASDSKYKNNSKKFKQISAKFIMKLAELRVSYSQICPKWRDR